MHVRRNRLHVSIYLILFAMLLIFKQLGSFCASRTHTFMSGILPRFASPQAHIPVLVSLLRGVSTQEFLSRPTLIPPVRLSTYRVGLFLANELPRSLFPFSHA